MTLHTRQMPEIDLLKIRLAQGHEVFLVFDSADTLQRCLIISQDSQSLNYYFYGTKIFTAHRGSCRKIMFHRRLCGVFNIMAYLMGYPAPL